MITSERLYNIEGFEIISLMASRLHKSRTKVWPEREIFDMFSQLYISSLRHAARVRQQTEDRIVNLIT